MVNLSALRTEHQRILRLQERALSLAAESAKTLGISTANSATPVKTGKLKAANRVKVIRSSTGRLIRMSNAKDYAAAIDKGSKPHTITAKAGGYLRFRGSRGWVRKRSVNHPGNKPFHFLHSGAQAASANFGKTFESLMSTGLRR